MPTWTKDQLRDFEARRAARAAENQRKWTADEILSVITEYSNPLGFDIAALVKQLGRTHAAIACKANELGLTSKRGCTIRTETARKNSSQAQKKRFQEHPEGFFDIAEYMAGKPNPFQGKIHPDDVRKIMSDRQKEWHKTHPHPRGMLGKHHSQATKDAISKYHTGKPVPPERTLRQMKTRVERYGRLSPVYKRGSWKAGWRGIGGKRIYARSRWEANYARYLEFLKRSRLISDWEHEPTTFWFHKIKRGVRSYLPDFRVTAAGKPEEYHEVKGWMDPRSATKLKRMAKYFPTTIVRLIDSAWFKANKTVGKIIKDWES